MSVFSVRYFLQILNTVVRRVSVDVVQEWSWLFSVMKFPDQSVRLVTGLVYANLSVSTRTRTTSLGPHGGAGIGRVLPKKLAVLVRKKRPKALLARQRVSHAFIISLVSVRAVREDRAKGIQDSFYNTVASDWRQRNDF